MQIILNADPQIADHMRLRSYLETVANEALGHYGGRLMRIDAHLSDANSAAKSSADDIHCTLEAQFTGMEPVIAKGRAAEPGLAIREAVGKLERAIGHAVGKLESRRAAVREEDPLSE